MAEITEKHSFEPVQLLYKAQRASFKQNFRLENQTLASLETALESADTQRHLAFWYRSHSERKSLYTFYKLVNRVDQARPLSKTTLINACEATFAREIASRWASHNPCPCMHGRVTWSVQSYPKRSRRLVRLSICFWLRFVPPAGRVEFSASGPRALQSQQPCIGQHTSRVELVCV